MSGEPPEVPQYRLEVRPAAVRDLERLDRATLARIDARLVALAQGADRVPAKRLRNSDFLSSRVGDYRILFLLNDAEGICTVARVRHRRDVYKNLPES